MRPRSIPSVGLLLLFCLLLAALTVGCRKPFELPVLGPQSVPAKVREHQVMLNETEVVWRVYERTDEYEFVAYTCVVLSPGGQRFEQYRIRVRWLDEDGAVIGSCFGFGDPQLRFWSATSSGTEYDYDQQKPVYSLCATGSAFDSAVTTVVGRTNVRTRVESKVFDGFWALHIEPAEYGENWVSLTATRADGSVVHRYQLRTAPSYRLPTDDVDPLAELPIISDESIATPIRQFAQGLSDTRGDHPTLVWRAYVQEGNYVYVAFTFEGPYTAGRGDLVVAAFDAASEFDLPLTAHASGPLKTSYAFTPVSWGLSGGTRGGQQVQTLKTGGLVLDERVTKIIGVTEQGRTVECTPFDGFWLLWCTYNKENPDPRVIEDRWVSIRAVDEDGEVLHGREEDQIPEFREIRSPSSEGRGAPVAALSIVSVSCPQLSHVLCSAKKGIAHEVSVCFAPRARSHPKHFGLLARFSVGCHSI